MLIYLNVIWEFILIKILINIAMIKFWRWTCIVINSQSLDPSIVVIVDWWLLFRDRFCHKRRTLAKFWVYPTKILFIFNCYIRYIIFFVFLWLWKIDKFLSTFPCEMFCLSSVFLLQSSNFLSLLPMKVRRWIIIKSIWRNGEKLKSVKKEK